MGFFDSFLSAVESSVNNASGNRTNKQRKIMNNKDFGGRSKGFSYCKKCGKRVTFGGKSRPDKAEADHIIPASYGGPDADFNIQVLCRTCNRKKGNDLFY